MSVEPIGLVTVLAGLACLAYGPALALVAFPCFTLLGAAAAAILPALGGANLQPSHVLLLFLCADLMLRPALLRHGLGGLRFPGAGFWLLLTAAYGIATTVIVPRLFGGGTYVFTPARSDDGAMTLITVPLAPSTANVTQSLYFVSDVLCFIVFRAYAGRRDPGQIVRAVAACGALNLAFAALDLATYHTNTAELLAFIRNASYRLLDDAETAGLKRIVGSFTEAAAFAYVTLALLAFNLRLWSEGVAARVTGPIALASTAALLFATSSTGYVGLAAVLAVQLAAALRRLLLGRAAPNTVVLLGLAPVLCAVLVAALVLLPGARASVSDLLDATLFNKLSSDSGVERGAWNRQAVVAIHDTLWLGAGIGSLRASSWLVAVPASIGAVGSLFYAGFVLAVLLGRDAGDGLARAVRAAARHACLAQLVAASVAGAFIDLGLGFFLFAGIASGLVPLGPRPAAPGPPALGARRAVLP